MVKEADGDEMPEAAGIVPPVTSFTEAESSDQTVKIEKEENSKDFLVSAKIRDSHGNSTAAAGREVVKAAPRSVHLTGPRLFPAEFAEDDPWETTDPWDANVQNKLMSSIVEKKPTNTVITDNITGKSLAETFRAKLAMSQTLDLEKLFKSESGRSASPAEEAAEAETHVIGKSSPQISKSSQNTTAKLAASTKAARASRKQNSASRRKR